MYSCPRARPAHVRRTWVELRLLCHEAHRTPGTVCNNSGMLDQCTSSPADLLYLILNGWLILPSSVKSLSLKLGIQSEKLFLVLWNFICSVSKPTLHACFSRGGFLGKHDAMAPTQDPELTEVKHLFLTKQQTPLPSPSLPSIGDLLSQTVSFPSSEPSSATSFKTKPKSLY